MGRAFISGSLLSSSRASIGETACMIHHMSAVTFAVRAMPEAITFYTQLGFTLVYGSPQARFRTLQAGEACVNLSLAPHCKPSWWGRTIFRVDNVETLYHAAVAQGLTPSAL